MQCTFFNSFFFVIIKACRSTIFVSLVYYSRELRIPSYQTTPREVPKNNCSEIAQFSFPLLPCSNNNSRKRDEDGVLSLCSKIAVVRTFSKSKQRAPCSRLALLANGGCLCKTLPHKSRFSFLVSQGTVNYSPLGQQMGKQGCTPDISQKCRIF